MKFGFVVPNNFGVVSPHEVVPLGVRTRLAVVRAEAAALGRDHVGETVQVRLDMSRVTAESLPDYADAGVSELVMSLNTADPTDIETGISRFAAEFIAPGRR